jgi:hypothetical protein
MNLCFQTPSPKSVVPSAVHGGGREELTLRRNAIMFRELCLDQ